MKNFLRKTGLSLLISIIVLSGAHLAFAAETADAGQLLTAQKTNEPTSYRVTQLKDIAMYYYWHGGDIKKAEEEIFKGITLKGNYDVVEHAFKEAAILDPLDLNIKFSLASTQIITGKTKDALATYQQILNLDPINFNANLLYGVYAKLEGDNAGYQTAFNKLKQLDKEKAAAAVNKVAAADAIQNVKFNTTVPAAKPAGKHAIVILGYALADDGAMRQPLIERLKVGLTAAEQYPDAKIIVTGGVPKQGITESDAMSKWLLEKGVAEDRIIRENKSTDTVENALFTTGILEKEKIQSVTLVTSASHMRRALVVFQEAAAIHAKINNHQNNLNLTNVVYLDYSSLAEAQKVPTKELRTIYRDLFRTAGIWAYPGVQR